MKENDIEMILIDTYHMLAEKCKESKRNIDVKSDKKLASGLLPKLCIALIDIDEDETLTAKQIRKSIIEAKTTFIQLCHIKARNPELITSIFEVRLEKLIFAMARHEARMIEDICMNNPASNLISVAKVFENKKYYVMLRNQLASVVYNEAIKEAKETLLHGQSIVYVTRNGAKYHVNNCPYCKGRALIEKTENEAEKLHLLPCKCISEAKAKDHVDKTHVTAFIDESIYPVHWDKEGQKGKIGSFSYILCWGYLKNEMEITPINTITKQVDYSRETKNVERITESAIGKVMISLAYDFNFRGELSIYVDNLSAAEGWIKFQSNEKLTKLFQKVTVTHVCRELNSVTDLLGRSMVFLCLPKTTYTSIVDKCEFYDSMQKKHAEKMPQEEQEALESEKEQNISAGEVDEQEEDIQAWCKHIFFLAKRAKELMYSFVSLHFEKRTSRAVNRL